MPGRCGLALLIAVAGCRPAAPGASHGQAAPPAEVPVRPFRIAAPDVVLLVTGGTNGMLEVCNCAGPMPGGLARRSGLVRSYRAAFRETFLIDTGDAFWVDPADLRNEFVLKGYAQIGYDAVVLGDQEWAAEGERIKRILAANDLAYLSSTVKTPGLTLRDVVTRRWPRGSVAFVSNVPREAFRFVPPQRVEPLSFAKPGGLAERIRRLKEGGSVVVMVAHAAEADLPAMVRACRPDLVLRGHTARTDEGVRRIEGTPVVKVGGSQTVGVVAMKLDGARLADLEYRVEVVDTTWPLDRRLIQTYQAYAHAAMRQALDAERTEGLDYVSSATCGKCHKRQYAAWQAGPHARAYKTLQRVRRTGDPNCLMCHTSGFGAKKGFYTYARTPQLAGVNCQNCHRFNVAEHRRKGFTFPRANKDVCTTCHTPVTDPHFAYKPKLPKVRCPISHR